MATIVEPSYGWIVGWDFTDDEMRDAVVREVTLDKTTMDEGTYILLSEFNQDELVRVAQTFLERHILLDLDTELENYHMALSVQPEITDNPFDY